MGQCKGTLEAVKAADIILIFHVPFFTKWLKEALRLGEESADTLPAFHGGGWTKGCKEWMAFMAPGLNAGGVNLVSAGYRLAPGHLFPTGLEDCMAALLALGPHRGRIAGCLPVSGVFEFGEGSGLPSRPRFWGLTRRMMPRPRPRGRWWRRIRPSCWLGASGISRI
jgi:hypothetical protein